MKKHIIWCLFFLFAVSTLSAKENVPQTFRRTETTLKLASGCQPASASANLDINNVRARIMNGGDMWWDLIGSANYEIPKVTQAGEYRKTSLFAGALWIGGYDQGNNLREAAMTYRQNSSWDFFPGPLNPNTASIDISECLKWDKIFQITREEINSFIQKGANTPTDNIRDWGRSDPSSECLAPFVDVDKDGKYDAEKGDYPDVKGDQTLWFVYNDKGNNHTETQSLAIGLEIQTMAFAFATNDEINNMTFYQQKIINRSKTKLEKVYFGQWVDADLGNAYDDYVGCDTTRGLGICYNGDDFDEGVNGYGSNPPSVGVDFFQGPKADQWDGIDNDKDGKIDEDDDPSTPAQDEEIIMSKFVYYNNDFSRNGNPEKENDYYYYLDGRFKDGARMKFGGDGYQNVWDASKIVNYMFPGNPKKNKPEWSEVSSGNTPGDRRFLQSAGMFTLKPGAVNYITVGVVWARATTGGNTGSYDLLLIADDKAQKLYNNNFKLIDGPNAPDVSVQELDRQIILSFENTTSIERYKDSIKNESGKYISYHFQGYQIYQLKDATVTSAELDNPDKARLVARCDIRDGVMQLVNRQFVPGLGIVPTEKVDINGDNGISHSFSITSDGFSSGDARLVNFRAYYFMVLSYSNSSDPNDFEQYLAGRKNIQIYTAVPHKNDIEFNGTKLNSQYGDGPSITRIEGAGNSGKILELTEATIKRILEVTNSDYRSIDLEYKQGFGPLNIYVFDPLKVINATYELRIIDSSIIKTVPVPGDFTKLKNSGNNKTSYWMITNLTTPSDTPVKSYFPFGVENEQVIPQWGLSVKVDNVTGPTSDTVTKDGGFIEATMEFKDPSKRWLLGIPDGNPADRTIPSIYNWIRSGKYPNGATAGGMDYAVNDALIENASGVTKFMDPESYYDKILNGIIAPYGLVARNKKGTVAPATGIMDFGPAYGESKHYDNLLDNISSIDLVFTKDKTLWSKCIVIEMGDDPKLTQGNVVKHFLRDHASWSNQYAVDANDKPIYNTAEKGMSWFPGYAINVETGERLNIIIAEDSYFSEDNGNDMLWNPTSHYSNPAAGFGEIDAYIFGGKHWIYVMNSKGQYPSFNQYYSAYDGCEKYHQMFVDKAYAPTKFDMRYLYSSAMWVMLPVLSTSTKLLSLQDGLIPTDTKIRIRVKKPYTTYKTSETPKNNNLPMYIFKTTQLAMTNSNELGKNALDKINIVPNPYYAYSKYEKNQLDNRVRLINLPKKCEISIYTLNGSLVRRLKKDETDANHQTYLDWDMKNHAGIPVASGLYIIYINAFELGNKTIKWFGIMRPIDLDTF
jgi:hypothetical protein